MESSEFIDSKFRLVILAAKRAKQLLRGGRKKVDMVAENPLTIALEEIKRGLINYEITDGTSRKPDLSIFGDSEEANGEEVNEVDFSNLDEEGAQSEPEDDPGSETGKADAESVRDEQTPDEPDPEIEERETQPTAE